MGAITRLATGGGGPARAKNGGVYADYGEGTSIVIGTPSVGGSRSSRRRRRARYWCIILFFMLTL